MSGRNQEWADLGLEVVRGEAAITRAKGVSEGGGESVLEVMDVDSAPGRRNYRTADKLRGQRRVRRGELDAIERKFNRNGGAWKLGFSTESSF